MNTKTILYSVLFLFVAQLSYGQTGNFFLKLDNVAFDEDEYMSIQDPQKNIVAYYDRFANKSGDVKAVKLFNLKKELIYTLVPLYSQQRYEVHIRNKEGKRGSVALISTLNNFSARLESVTDYFQKDYYYNHQIRLRIGSAKTIESVRFKNQEIVSSTKTLSVFSKPKPVLFKVDEEFFKENKMDVANWVLIIQLFEELMLEVSKHHTDSDSSDHSH